MLLAEQSLQLLISLVGQRRHIVIDELSELLILDLQFLELLTNLPIRVAAVKRECLNEMFVLSAAVDLFDYSRLHHKIFRPGLVLGDPLDFHVKFGTRFVQLLDLAVDPLHIIQQLVSVLVHFVSRFLQVDRRSLRFEALLLQVFYRLSFVSAQLSMLLDACLDCFDFFKDAFLLYLFSADLLKSVLQF